MTPDEKFVVGVERHFAAKVGMTRSDSHDRLVSTMSSDVTSLATSVG